MTEKKLLAAAFAALTIGTAPAFAADLGGPPIPARVIPAPIEVGGGWYLRGDVGIGIQDFRSVRLTPDVPGFGMVQQSMDDTFMLGAGIGYQFNDWLRFDGTIEYRATQSFQFLLNNGGPAGQFNNYNGRVGSVVGLVNAYVDIGNFYGLTPFVGVGAGFAHHHVSGFQDFGLIAAAGGFGYASAANTTNFAWALHAGVAYTVNEALRLELSYRYLDMGHVGAGTIVCQGAVPCNPLISYQLRDYTSHDIRLGMRWTFGAPPRPVPVVARN